MSPLVAAALDGEFETMTKPRIKVPSKASAGDIITIKTLLSHTMESGHRENADGEILPRKIINKFECLFDDVEVFSCAIGTAIASNPFFEFRTKVTKSGTFTFRWTDDDGSITKAQKSIEIS